MRRHAPGILSIKSQPLDVLRKAAVAGGRSGTGGSTRNWKRGSGGACQIHGELRGMARVERGILGENREIFRIGGKRTAQDRFMDEVHAETRRVASGAVCDVVANLIFFLIAQDGKRRDGRNELVVAESFETGDGLRCRTEWKSQREAEVGVTRLREMQIAHSQGERSEPGGAEDVLLPEHCIEIVVVRRRSGGRQSGLL